MYSAQVIVSILESIEVITSRHLTYLSLTLTTRLMALAEATQHFSGRVIMKNGTSPAFLQIPMV